MISGLDEVLEARSALEKAAAAADVAPERFEMGVMIEVPSAALNASVIAPHVDFFSIGTNDLTQYTLAVERGNEGVAAIADPLDPAVVKLIDMVCRSAEAYDVRVAVCGEVAADTLAVPILAGLGVRELSVSPPAVPSVKDEVRRWSSIEMGEIAARALDCPTATAVRALVTEHRKGLAPIS
jgi:phosphocarrier protein FPr